MRDISEFKSGQIIGAYLAGISVTRTARRTTSNSSNSGQLTAELNVHLSSPVSATTHRRVKEFGYSCRIPLVKPLLNHRQRQRRLTWAKEKKNWTVAQWSKVLFSNESKFCISFGNQGP
uniref:Transposase Tc1-like domain-containing protein n=1 Tax=Cyprinus carpio carpio TaxID=630221 RepID=A0A9J8A6J3_CYPCA